MKIMPEVSATIYLYHTNYGGKKFPISAELRDYFGCPIFFEKTTKQGYDCRIYLNDRQVIHPGDVCTNLPIKFLDWDTIKYLISSGKQFYLWEGRFFGEGTIEKILTENPVLDETNCTKILKFRLHSLIDSLAKFLKMQGESNWRNRFEKVLREIDSRDLQETAINIMENYSGMNSFKCLTLQLNDKSLALENDILESLRRAIYDTCKEITSSKN